MKKIFFAFPSNRTGTVNRVAKGLSPDNELYGLNYMNKFGLEAGYGDVYPPAQKLLDIIFLPLYKLFRNQIDIGFHLGRAILLLPKMNRADIVITNTDSIGLPVCLLKRLGFVNPPIICAVGLFYIQGGLKTAIDLERQTLFRRFYVWILSAADHIIYHSPIEKEKLVKLGLYNPAYCSFVPMGSDGIFFKSYQSSTISHQPSIILSVGRDHSRDYETLFSTAKKLPELNFVVICSRRNIEGLKIPANVTVLIDIPYREVASWYEKSSMVVLPMREMHRSSGQISLIDALHSGKPVIVSDVSGISHYGLKTEQDVIMVRPESYGDLIKAIKLVTANQKLRLKLIENGKLIAGEFTTKNYAAMIAEIAKEVDSRTSLRPIRESDLEFLRKIRNDNSRFFLSGSYISIPAQRKWFEGYQNTENDFMFILEQSGKRIGTGGVYNIDKVKKEAEIGKFAIEEKLQNQGFGKILLEKIEKLSFKELGLRKLRLEVFSDNKRAVNLYKASGFEVEKAFKAVQGKEILLMIKSIYERSPSGIPAVHGTARD